MRLNEHISNFAKSQKCCLPQHLEDYLSMPASHKYTKSKISAAPSAEYRNVQSGKHNILPVLPPRIITVRNVLFQILHVCVLTAQFHVTLYTNICLYQNTICLILLAELLL